MDKEKEKEEEEDEKVVGSRFECIQWLFASPDFACGNGCSLYGSILWMQFRGGFWRSIYLGIIGGYVSG